jgi:mannose-1-phosphate guanylyltransferase
MLYALIMAGGVGERFWPRSRQETPKQLLDLSNSGNVLLEDTVLRLESLIELENIYIVTNEKQVSNLKTFVKQVSDKQIIAEPMSRNTAACIGLTAGLIYRKDKNAEMLVLPADHMITDKQGFKKTVESAQVAADLDKLVTIGIKPLRPETEYGYIEVGENIENNIFKVKSFKEKPNKEIAKEFCDAGNFLWNSGIFVWKVKVILDAIKEHMPELYEWLDKIINCEDENKLQSIIEDMYSKIDSISIDYGIMEKSENAAVVQNLFDWDDLGMWTAMERIYLKDENSIIAGDVISVEAKNNIVYTDEGVVGIVGLDDIVVVREGNAVLVCKKDKAKDVKKIINELKQKNMKEYL